MQHFLPIDAGFGVLQPEARVGEHDRHRRQRFQPVFVDEVELAAIHRVGAEPQAECVEDRILRAVGVLDRRERPVLQFLIVDRH